jgi:hypothetical protein
MLSSSSEGSDFTTSKGFLARPFFCLHRVVSYRLTVCMPFSRVELDPRDETMLSYMWRFEHVLPKTAYMSIVGWLSTEIHTL